MLLHSLDPSSQAERERDAGAVARAVLTREELTEAKEQLCLKESVRVGIVKDSRKPHTLHLCKFSAPVVCAGSLADEHRAASTAGIPLALTIRFVENASHIFPWPHLAIISLHHHELMD